MTPRHRLAWVFLFATACSHHGRPPLVAHAVDPGLVEMTAEATEGLLLATSVDELGIRVRITARVLPPSQQPPLNVALVLDTSGSMDGAAIDAVRASALELAAKLRDGDRISIVAFHSRADLLVESTLVDAASRQ